MIQYRKQVLKFSEPVFYIGLFILFTFTLVLVFLSYPNRTADAAPFCTGNGT